MQAKHTPGPWAVNGPTISSAPTDAAPTGYALAHVLNPYAGATGAAARVDANAALIAAAPDLLAALQDARTMVYGMTGDAPASAPWNAMLPRIDAVISRATGEA